VVKGRLVEINHTPVQQIVSKDTQGENATHRELSLTWTIELPEENKIVAGNWWNNQQTGLVSVEQKLADSLKIKLGDLLTFTVGSQQINATVASIRETSMGYHEAKLLYDFLTWHTGCLSQHFYHQLLFA